MLDVLKRLFSAEGEGAETPEEREDALRLATAVLLTEMRRADFAEDPAERETMLGLLRERFSLTQEEAGVLLFRSEVSSDDSVSFYEFTSRLNESLDHEEKRKIIVMLWQVAFADGRLDKYEDYVVRKIADLMHVPHADLIALKYRAMALAGLS